MTDSDKKAIMREQFDEWIKKHDWLLVNKLDISGGDYKRELYITPEGNSINIYFDKEDKILKDISNL